MPFSGGELGPDIFLEVECVFFHADGEGTTDGLVYLVKDGFGEVEFFILPIDLHPHGVGRPLLGRKQSSLPHAQYVVQPYVIFEEGYVHISR